MKVAIYGLQGYASGLETNLEELELEELETGAEFTFDGKVYEIRSVYEGPSHILINVMLVMHYSYG